MSQRQNTKSTSNPTSQTFGWVLASIQEMIDESIYFCETFSHTLHVHHNRQAAEVFQKALQSFQQEAHIVLEAIQSHNPPLPKISPWEKPYNGYQHPAVTLMDADYLITESAAWLLVENLIQVHQSFYHYLQEAKNNEPQSSEQTLKLVGLLIENCSHCRQNSQSLT